MPIMVRIDGLNQKLRDIALLLTWQDKTLCSYAFQISINPHNKVIPFSFLYSIILFAMCMDVGL